jgi:hypothetical protein
MQYAQNRQLQRESQKKNLSIDVIMLDSARILKFGQKSVNVKNIVTFRAEKCECQNHRHFSGRKVWIWRFLKFGQKSVNVKKISSLSFRTRPARFRGPAFATFIACPSPQPLFSEHPDTPCPKTPKTLLS